MAWTALVQGRETPGLPERRSAEGMNDLAVQEGREGAGNEAV